LFGSAICFVAASAIIQHSFVLLCISTFLLGTCSAGFQQIRFAAMESVKQELMPKAASTVLLGGLVAAFLGPELVTLGNSLVLTEFVGGFYLLAGLLCLCALLLSRIENTHVAVVETELAVRSLSIIARQPIFILAVSSSVVGYALMSFIMTATPVHMHITEHHSLLHTKWVIQSHVFAMFFPSLFSGWLISKFGAHKIIALGIAAYLLTIIIGLVDHQLINYWLALILLGIGWNFLFVGGTVLLTQSYRPEERFKVQGLNELLVFSCQATASLSAGIMLSLFGWNGLLILSFCIVLIFVLFNQGVKFIGKDKPKLRTL
jgi:MFS family permease